MPPLIAEIDSPILGDQNACNPPLTEDESQTEMKNSPSVRETRETAIYVSIESRRVPMPALR
jgi:hypothetical protein